MTTRLKIEGGAVYDPANGIDGEVRDLWIAEGRIVARPDESLAATFRRIDARGLIVMPGGIDMHCHIAGGKVNTGRKMRPDERRENPQPRTSALRGGTMGSIPSSFTTGYKYLGMGYTTAFDAAIPPISARSVHEELADTPCIDKGFYLLMGNNHYAMEAMHKGEHERLRNFMAWILGTARGYAVKLVNPGGVEVWKQQARGTVHTLDDEVGFFDVTPRQILREMAHAADDLGLPHAVHIHASNLGLPGNWQTTLETMHALEGHRGHLTHIQFHSYGGGEGDENTFNSKVAPLADYINAHENLSVDVGQVMFGNTTSMTGDGAVGYFLANLYKSKWYSNDTELEAGCGVAPIEYKNKSLVHALQWAIGLEWYLMVEDPWRVVMSTDHPNGGSFLAYPQIIQLLMDRNFREEALKMLPPEVRERSQLADLQREYSLREIAIITRAGPARLLGLKNKGHLGIGADADITIYSPHANKQQMFELPRYVIKGGEVVVEDCEIRLAPFGKTLHVSPEFDRGQEEHIAEWFERVSAMRFANYAATADVIPSPEKVECG